MPLAQRAPDRADLRRGRGPGRDRAHGERAGGAGTRTRIGAARTRSRMIAGVRVPLPDDRGGQGPALLGDRDGQGPVPGTSVITITARNSAARPPISCPSIQIPNALPVETLKISLNPMI